MSSMSLYSHFLSLQSCSLVRRREDIQVVNSRRSWIIDQLAALVRNGAIPKDDDWLQTILDWLTVQGMFIVKKKSDKSAFLAVCLLACDVSNLLLLGIKYGHAECLCSELDIRFARFFPHLYQRTSRSNAASASSAALLSSPLSPSSSRRLTIMIPKLRKLRVWHLMENSGS